MGGQAERTRLFDRVGVDADAVVAMKLRSLRRLVLLTLACESWFVLGYVPYSRAPGVYGTLAFLMTACAVAGWRDRLARPALAATFLLEAGIVVSVFPENANHQFLSLILLTLLLLVGSDRSTAQPSVGDARACLQSTRWIVVIGLAWAGVMKLLSGYWLGGEFLAYRIALDPGFATVFAPVVPEPELVRLVALENRVGEGPFRAAAPGLILLSNLTWIAELALPAGLLFARTRMLSVVGSLLLMLAIQLGARELFFAGLMVGGLLLFAARDRLAPALPVIGAVYGAWLLRAELSALLGVG